MLPNPAQTERFHQARWNEPIILQLSTPGERGIVVEEAEPGVVAEVGDAMNLLPANMRRQTLPALPEMSQMRVLRHYSGCRRKLWARTSTSISARAPAR